MKVQTELIVFVTLCVIMSSTKNSHVHVICIAALIVCSLVHIYNSKSTVYDMKLLDFDHLNEALIIDTFIGNTSFLFLIDTGYAGPPVISKSYLAIKDPIHLNLKDRYNSILESLPGVTENDEHFAINKYIHEGNCLPYTSGCTMKLMGIGSVQEHQADMLLCPMLKIKNCKHAFHAPKKNTNTFADVFVTNSLKGSIHILTCDFILHHSPCLICMKRQQVEFNLSPVRYVSIKPSFFTFEAKLSGGAFVVPFELENGQVLNCTVDTGSPGPICVGANAISKLQTCVARNGRKSLQQNGVNGETICSEILETTLKFAGKSFNTIIFVNNLPTDSVDGYVGLAFLRAFDILITKDGIGFKRNGLQMKTIDNYLNVATSKGCEIELKCLE